MAKNKIVYICRECGGESSKWLGKCPYCEQWNTLEEVITQTSANKSILVDKTNINAVSVNEIDCNDEQRFNTGINEFNRVLGGGLVKGSVVLLSGDPGIGKSTILLQICNNFKDEKVLYVTGEESKGQIKLRANRLNVDNENLLIMCCTDILSICEYIKEEKPTVVVIDSIQTMQNNELSNSPGSITQVRECTSALLKVGKALDIPIIIVGHINKGGDIAGPKVMEHIVDTVLYFEGEKSNSYRMLRAIKNRFGSTNEIGVFEMQSKGLQEVENPSALMLSGKLNGVSGSSICSIIEGSRPIFVEIQALTTATAFGNPRRMAAGYDYNRLNLILAVLEKRAGLFYSNLDVYLNVVGGLKLYEPSADLAITASLISAFKDKPIKSDICLFGEVGLSGEVRAVPQAVARVAEAERMGFNTCILPKGCYKQVMNLKSNINLEFVSTISELVEKII